MIELSNRLDRQIVQPDLGPNCLQKLSRISNYIPNIHHSDKSL